MQTPRSEPIASAARQTLATWHEILHTRDLARLPAIIHPDALFRSPAFFKPYHGRDALVLILSTVLDLFEDFTYHREFITDDETSAVLEFSARIGERQIDGADFIAFDAEGLITEFKVMVRPMTSLETLAAAMKARIAEKLAALG